MDAANTEMTSLQECRLEEGVSGPQYLGEPAAFIAPQGIDFWPRDLSELSRLPAKAKKEAVRLIIHQGKPINPMASQSNRLCLATNS